MINPSLSHLYHSVINFLKFTIKCVVLVFAIAAISAGVVFAQTTYTVTNTDDSGVGSFRWAVDQVNADANPAIIDFNISGDGPHVIQPATQYTSFTNSVIIDGTTQSGYTDGAPAIVFDGVNGGNIPALVFTGTAENSVVRGLSIINFQDFAIRLVSGGNTIQRKFNRP